MNDNFNFEAQTDALAILMQAKRDACTGPDSAYRILYNAYNRLDRELHQYLSGKK